VIITRGFTPHETSVQRRIIFRKFYANLVDAT
jgi:hypothetical protein